MAEELKQPEINIYEHVCANCDNVIELNENEIINKKYICPDCGFENIIVRKSSNYILAFIICFCELAFFSMLMAGIGLPNIVSVLLKTTVIIMIIFTWNYFINQGMPKKMVNKKE